MWESQSNILEALALFSGPFSQNENKYLNEFKQQKEDQESDLELMNKPGTSHYLIYLKPAFEDWLATQSERLGIDLKKYNVKGRKDLRRFKSLGCDPQKQVYNLLNTLWQKQESPLKAIERIDEIIGSSK